MSITLYSPYKIKMGWSVGSCLFENKGFKHYSLNFPITNMKHLIPIPNLAIPFRQKSHFLISYICLNLFKSESSITNVFPARFSQAPNMDSCYTITCKFQMSRCTVPLAKAAPTSGVSARLQQSHHMFNVLRNSQVQNEVFSLVGALEQPGSLRLQHGPLYPLWGQPCSYVHYP